MKKKFVIISILFLALTSIFLYQARGGLSSFTPFFPPSGGYLSPYLIGKFDFIDNPFTGVNVSNGNFREWRYHVHNPTATNLIVLFAFFNFDEEPIFCFNLFASSNGVVLVSLTSDIVSFINPGFIGTVKIVSFDSTGTVVKNGIVGFQEQFDFGPVDATTGFLQELAKSDANLKSVPNEVLAEGELQKIRTSCEGITFSSTNEFRASALSEEFDFDIGILP